MPYTSTVDVAATGYAAHGLLTGDGEIFDLDLQANERAAHVVFTAISDTGAVASLEAIGRMVPEEGWSFAYSGGLALASLSGTHLAVVLDAGDDFAVWQGWVRITFTQNYEGA